MLDVQLLLKALSHPSQKLLTGRQAFKNYLMNQSSEDQLLDADSVNQFFLQALFYPHWQQSAAVLTKEIRSLLEEVNRKRPFPFNWDEVLWPDKIQVIQLKHQNQINDVLQNYYNDLRISNYKLFNDLEMGYNYCIVLQSNGELTVHQHDQYFWIQHGKLEPLKSFHLYYTDDLELDPIKQHRLEISPFTQAQWTTSNQGSIYKGFMFEKVQNLSGKFPLKLFYGIKRIEQFFLDRKSDPYYNKVTQDIEKSIQLIKIQDPQAVYYASQVLAEAQNALECVFIGDKILNLLAKDLNHTLQNTEYDLSETKKKHHMQPRITNSSDLILQGQLDDLELIETPLKSIKPLENEYRPLKRSTNPYSETHGSSLHESELIEISKIDTLPRLVKDFLG